MLGWLFGIAIALGPAMGPTAGATAGSVDSGSSHARASVPAPTLPAAALDDHRRRTSLGLAGMGTLTGWATVNIAAGVAGNLTTTSTARFFHQGNWMWNTVNLALGVGGLVSQRRDRARPVSMAEGRAVARKAQLVFGINAGLDVVYLSAGAFTWTVGRDLGQPRVHGYGQALVLQGAFLFAFDVGMMLGHERLIERTRLGQSARLRLGPTAVASPGGRLVPGLTLRLR